MTPKSQFLCLFSSTNQVLLFCSYVPNPVLVIIDVQPKELGIPSKAYYAVEEVKEVDQTSLYISTDMLLVFSYLAIDQYISSILVAFSGKSLFLIKPDSYVGGTRTNSFIWLQNATQKSQKVFVHVPSVIAAHEVEEIGILIVHKAELQLNSMCSCSFSIKCKTLVRL